MGLHYGELWARPNRAKHDDIVRKARPEAIQARADEPKLTNPRRNRERQNDLRAAGNRVVRAAENRLFYWQYGRSTSMTPDSHASTCDENGRSEAPSGPESGLEGWTSDGVLYDAFISYSRGNIDAADKIEHDLETFPLPREIRKRLGRRHLNVFRDESDMTGNRLDPALEHNLEQSRTLVVLCSPAARRSRYVSMEIKRFAQLRETGQILPVLVAGGPNNDPDVDAADWAFPDALSEVLGSDPLAADLRRAWNTKRRRDKLARGSPWVQLVAGILGATTDDLTERIAKAQRRHLLKTVGYGGAVLAGAAGWHNG